MRAEFTTENGSCYEIDTTSVQIRRLCGVCAPTVNQGDDGEWQDYLYCSPVITGEPVLIEWRIDHTCDGVAIIRRTFTSRVTGLTVTSQA